MSDEKEHISYCEQMPQIGLVNFIMENLGQCFRKYQKDFFFFETEIEIGKEAQ